jgi:alkanesulfonate monooxygenase SsuD/methylene tetrahydromethanopterin reductase-like flavin-dependent oxidoreductase (luciferase family)
VFLAKQLATLDRISGGRAVPVFGAGWHRAEYASCNMPFENKFTHMEEQIGACRALWAGGPSAFHGKIVDFEALWSYPLPVRGDMPIWVGISPSPRNIERMARLADGWLPAMESLEVIADTRAQVEAMMAQQGRTGSFEIRKGLVPIYGADGTPDAGATFAQAEAMAAAGVDVVDIAPIFLSERYDDVEATIDRLVALKG